MRIKTRRDSNVTLETFALTDIILNIFIFFFTAFSLVYTFNPLRESKIIIKLPQADVKTPPEQKEPIIINITNRNEVFLSNKPKNIKELKTELSTLMAFDKMRPVIVRADKGVVLEKVVEVLDIAKSSGVDRLGIAVEEKPTPNYKSP